MRDRTVGDTFYMLFTTRAFSSGVPTTLAGSPVLSAYEDNSATQITAGITLGVDHDSIDGLNLITVVATTGNGYEAGKDYSFVITTGTVGGVSVVGEVVGEFSLSLSAASKDLANGTDGLGAIKADTAAILVDTAAMQPLVARIPLSDGTITFNATALASINTQCDTALTDYDAPTNTEMVAAFTEIKGSSFASTDTLEAIRDRGDSAWTTGGGGSAPTVAQIRTEMDDNSTKLASILEDTGTTIPATIATAQDDLDIITGASGVNLLTATQNSITAIEADTNELQGNQADWATATGFATTAEIADVPTVAEFNARTPSAAELAYMVDNASTGLPVTFTTSGGATTTAVINQIDGAAGSSIDDQYNGRLIVFTNGTLKGVVTDITDYVGSSTTATITAVPTAPTSAHTARLI